MKTASMNQQQKREKAAELLGWKRFEHPTTSEGIWVEPRGFFNIQMPLPRYDEDLNLMAEAEKVMTGEQRERVTVWLGNIVLGHGSTWLGRKEIFKLCHATAAQRLDAWLEAMMEEKQ